MPFGLQTSGVAPRRFRRVAPVQLPRFAHERGFALEEFRRQDMNQKKERRHLRSGISKPQLEGAK